MNPVGSVIGEEWQRVRNNGAEPTSEAPPSLDTAHWRIVEQYDYAATVKALRDGTLQRPTPEIGERDDGQGLIYRGRVNGIAGPSGSGKSWVALHVALQYVRAGACGTVVYIDFEDNATGILSRLVDLGATDTDLAGFFYVHPDEPYSTGIADTFTRRLGDTAAPEGIEHLVVIIDSTGEALALDGFKSIDEKDYSTWHRRLPTALANLGATVILVDHISRSDEKDGDGLHAIGSQRKRASITGASYMLRPTKPFAQGHDGAARLICSKDRHGCYRQGEKVADFTVTTGPAGTLTTTLTAPGIEVDTTFRPTVLMERVSRYLELHPGESKRTILDTVTGNKAGKITALDVLITEGYVAIDKQGQTHQHTSLRPFREDESQ